MYKYLIATRDAPRIFPLFSGFYGGSQLLSRGEALEAVAENVTGGLESSKTVNRRATRVALRFEGGREERSSRGPKHLTFNP